VRRGAVGGVEVATFLECVAVCAARVPVPSCGLLLNLTIWQEVVGCLLGRVFVPMVCDGSLLAGYLLRLSTLRLCNKRLLTSDWRG
jgi:hypothetical protein